MAPALRIKWRCRDGVEIDAGGDTPLAIAIDGEAPVRLKPKTPGLSEALLRLRDGADESELLATAGDEDDAASLLYYYLGRLRKAGLLVADLWSDSALIATLLPRSR